jgi:hypothetical protein
MERGDALLAAVEQFVEEGRITLAENSPFIQTMSLFWSGLTFLLHAPEEALEYFHTCVDRVEGKAELPIFPVEKLRESIASFEREEL